MKPWSGALERYAETVARQTGRLLATLATSQGARMRVDWLLDMVFVSVVDELAAQGVPRRVAADMLGLSHRTLQRNYAAASDALHLRGRSVWATIVEILREGPCTREALAAKAGRVPPLIVASVLNNMLESGWVVEDGDQIRLMVESSQGLSQEALRTFVEIRRRIEPAISPDKVASELEIDLQQIQAVWELSETLLHHAEGDNVWMAMERYYRFVMRVLVDTSAKRDWPQHFATTWSIRLDDKPEEFQTELRGFLNDLNERIEGMLAPLATRDVDDPEARYWHFTAVQTTELDQHQNTARKP